MSGTGCLVVEKQGLAPGIGDEGGDAAVVVEIADRQTSTDDRAHRPADQSAADIIELTSLVVVVEQRWFAERQVIKKAFDIVVRVAVALDEVEPAVVVVIEPLHAEGEARIAADVAAKLIVLVAEKVVVFVVEDTLAFVPVVHL